MSRKIAARFPRRAPSQNCNRQSESAPRISMALPPSALGGCTAENGCLDHVVHLSHLLVQVLEVRVHLPDEHGILRNGERNICADAIDSLPSHLRIIQSSLVVALRNQKTESAWAGIH
jgi:hypothetical protein